MTHVEGQRSGSGAEREPSPSPRDAGRAPLVWRDEPLRTENGRVVSVCHTSIPEDYVYFEGHFRGYPVLAGVVQLHELVLPSVRQVHVRLIWGLWKGRDRAPATSLLVDPRGRGQLCRVARRERQSQ